MSGAAHLSASLPAEKGEEKVCKAIFGSHMYCRKLSARGKYFYVVRVNHFGLQIMFFFSLARPKGTYYSSQKDSEYRTPSDLSLSLISTNKMHPAWNLEQML